jgi:undecaprenyl diphosphate synthase
VKNDSGEHVELRHLAVIMDGNGRWAERQGKPRDFGHQVGADNLRRLCVLCRERNIRYVTVYAFSTENWRRPRLEVAALMRIFPIFFRKYAKEMEQEGIRLRFIGERDELSAEVVRTMREAEESSADRTALDLIIAFNYGGRRELVSAAQNLAREVLTGKLSPDKITEETFRHYLYMPDVPDPDLLIRTGGEYRTSNFLIWQTAYTELYIDDCLWPEFGAKELDRAITEYHSRQRRFGGIQSE